MEERERIRTLREQILLELYGARPLKLKAETVARRLKSAQFDFTADEVSRELDALKQFGLAAGEISPDGGPRWSITGNGIIAHENNA